MQKVVKLSGNSIDAISNTLGKLKENKLPMNVSMWIIRNVKYMEKEVTPILELSDTVNKHEYLKQRELKRTEIFEKYSKKDEDGNTIKTEEYSESGEVLGYRYSLLDDDISKANIEKESKQLNVDLLDLNNDYKEKVKELKTILSEEVDVNVYTIDSTLLIDSNGNSLFTVEELYTIEALIEY